MNEFLERNILGKQLDIFVSHMKCPCSPSEPGGLKQMANLNLDWHLWLLTRIDYTPTWRDLCDTWPNCLIE